LALRFKMPRFTLPGFAKQEVMSLSNLREWAPEPHYMLAIKCVSARWDTLDRYDAIYLLKELKLKKLAEVSGILESYYPHKRIEPKTKFLPMSYSRSKVPLLFSSIINHPHPLAHRREGLVGDGVCLLISFTQHRKNIPHIFCYFPSAGTDFPEIFI